MKKVKSNVTIQSRRRLFFIRPICLFFISFLLITFATNSYQLYELKNEQKKRNEEYDNLLEKTEYLRNEIIKLNNPEYIAKYARENYSYSKDDEIVIKIDEKEKEPVNVTTSATENKVDKKVYYIIGGGILIITMVISALKKKGEE